MSWLSPLLGGAALLVVIAIGIQISSKLLRKPPKGNGFAAPGWYKVGDVFRRNLDSGLEQGAGFVVYYKGEMVVEFYGGYADYDAEWHWDKEVISQAISSSKGITAIIVAMLVDRGLLDYSKPVVLYWPDFGQNGKEEITVEQLLSHQAGLAIIDEKYSAYDMNDPVKMGKILAAQKTNWDPGSEHGYHGITHGLYLDQIVRRVDPQHRSMQQFLDEEIVKPMDLDMYLGLPKEEFYRCNRVYPFNPLSLETFTASRYWPAVWNYLTDSQSLVARSINNPPEWSKDGIENHPNFKQIQNPSTHIFGTPDSFARLYGTIASNTEEKEEDKLLSDSTRAKLFEPLTSGRDNILSMNLTYGRGGTLRTSMLGSTMYGTPGSGGQMIYMDADYELGWAYLTNHHSIHAIGDDPRYLALEKAMYQCLKELSKNR